MIRRTALWLVLSSTVLFACDRGGREAPADIATANVPTTIAPTNCLEAEGTVNLVFSNVERSEETGDLSGTAYRFECSESGRWRGDVRLARGEMGDPMPIEVDVMSHLSDSLRFHFGTGDALTTFDGRISCDSIWGRVSMFDSAVVVSRIYRRQGASPPTCPWVQFRER